MQVPDALLLGLQTKPLNIPATGTFRVIAIGLSGLGCAILGGPGDAAGTAL